ncbi:hypothetical protein PVAP13_1NG043908 [Panicum virgatum]|uniref:Secreted protein n=1 Tax=Panicum virgatum TaxID=38727 RepID=A0A8T0WQZ9_PANVG|nr:hypothetical protein PVAP13_1NG043908 [Panicum virgatum]
MNLNVLLFLFICSKIMLCSCPYLQRKQHLPYSRMSQDIAPAINMLESHMFTFAHISGEHSIKQYTICLLLIALYDMGTDKVRTLIEFQVTLVGNKILPGRRNN